VTIMGGEGVDQNAAETRQALVKALPPRQPAAQIDTAETLKVLGKNFPPKQPLTLGIAHGGAPHSGPPTISVVRGSLPGGTALSEWAAM
jgi:hypothetical protein